MARAHLARPVPLAFVAVLWLGLASPPALAASGTVSTCTWAGFNAVYGAAPVGGTITFACAGTITPPATVTISSNTILDASATAGVVFSGAGNRRIFRIQQSGRSLELRGVDLRNGYAADLGGGAAIQNEGGSVTISDGVVQSNVSTIGGAIYNNLGTVTITGSTFTNHNNSGTGGVIDNRGTLIISDSTFESNSGTARGVIYSLGATTTISGSSFVGNSAGTNFGIVEVEQGVLTVTNSTFSGNARSPIVADSGATATVVHSTFADNQDGPFPDDAYVGLRVQNAATMHLAGNLLVTGEDAVGSNCTSSSGGQFVDHGYNLSDGPTCGFSATSSADLEDFLIPLAFLSGSGPGQQVHRPHAPSPAIRIPNGTTLDINGVTLACNGNSTDQLANARPLVAGDVCTVGAVEVTDPTPCGAYDSPYVLGTSIFSPPDLVTDLRFVLDCSNRAGAVGIIDLAGQTVTLPDAPMLYDGHGYNGLPRIAGSGNVTLRNGTIQRSSSLLACAAGNNRQRFRLLEVDGGRLTLEGVTLRNGCAYQDTTPSLANNGGAVLVASGALEVLGSHFVGNKASGGGAVYTESPYTLVNSSFVGNSAGNVGSALWTKVTTGSNQIVNTTFSGNGDFAYYSDDAVGLATSFINTTFAGHTGFTPLNAADNLPTLIFRNTIVDHSAGSGPACGISGATVTESNNYASDSSCGFSNSGAASAPLGALTQAANGVYYYPLADGAAVDGGNGTFLPTETSLGLDVNGDGSIASAPINVDTRGAGFARVACGQVDLGAAERQNCAPTGVQLSPSSVPESAAIGSLVGTLSTIDPNLGDTHTYTFVSNPGNRFQISAGNQLRTAALLDYETASSHAITVRTTDAAGASFDAALTVTVLDVQHQVTPSAGSNGSLSPSTPQSVDHSATIAFTVTASPGYQIASVTGCGGSLAGSTYTTGAITAACTVSASFSLLPCATFVSPANGATNVAVAATLNWSLPAGATGASLSFGTDGGGLLPPSNLVNGAAMGTATSFDPMPDLQQGTIHYWRVVPANAFGAALNCPIWSFTTLTDADGDGIPDEIDTCPLIPDPSNADLDRPAGSVAHWGFNDGAGAVATDSLGGHDGTVTGAAWVSGQADGALSFDGSGDSVVVPHHPDLDFDTHDEMTLAMWLKLPANQVDASSNANPILDKLSGSVFPYSVFVRNQTHARSGEVELRQGDGTTTITLLSSVPINDNQWHHLAFVGDGDNLRAYVDGVLTNTIANTLSGSTSNTANVRIGARLTGTIDGITVVRRALAGYEIAALAASPPSADGVGNVCDVCPGLPDADQQDSDGDGLGDACDAVDLSLTVADVADPVLEGRSLGYTLAVTNAGPSAATDVVLSASVPAGTSFVSATGSGWPCSESAGTVTCLRATLAVGAAPTVTLALTAPADAGVNPSVQLAASVSSADVEAWPGDESATESTAIGPLPVVSIADAQILEGDSGVSNMLFTVTLSEPPVLPVEVIFETADGTAVLNEDYNTRDGTVSFAVGQTTGTAYVILKGDPLYELDETFSVVLQSFDLTNAVLGDATATGTILNDDPLVQRTLVVTGTGDAIANDGVCTLREAIRRANAPGWFVDDCGWGQPYLPGEPLTRDRIVFAIPDPLPIANELDKALSAVTGVGPIFTIHLGSALPAITDAVEIDGTTQPGADCTSWPPTLKVVLDGSALSGAEDGLAIGAADTIVRGLAIHSFPGDGVDISGSDVRLACNFIGTGANGSVDLGNGGAGVRISGSPVGVLVGTDGDGVGDVAERNLISGNDGGGVHVTGIGGAIAGNWIGPDSSGACGIGNATAGIIADSVELLVGADVDDPGGVEGNLIACNLAHGMVVSGAATDGLTARGNQIRDNAGAGVVVSGVPEDVNLDGNHVGGNAGAGVLVASDAHGVHLRRNRLDGNGGLGIDLVAAGAVADGVTANDTGDADTGANGLQNFPVLESALYTGSAVVVTGHLESTANADFVIEFFASDEADASGHGEGSRFLGELAVSTDGSGHANVSTSLSGIAADEWLSATATDEDGNTSEFSAVRSLLIATTLSIDSDDPDPSTVGQAFEVQVSVASADPGTPATGSVAVSAAGAGNCVAVLANGSGACQLTGTSPGPTTIEASYAGNSSHAAASASAAHSIGLAASSTTITADTPDPSSFGEAVTVSVSVSSASGTPTGSVTIGDGLGTSCSAALSAGSGSCALTPAQGGALTLSAQYPGNGNFLASSDSEPHQVLAVASTLAILAHTPDPSVAGQPVNVSVLLSSGVGTPAGPVVVSDGAGASCQVAGASGNCNLIPTGIGSVPLDANFAGDANHLASSASSAHQIDRAGTATVAGAPFWPQFPAEPPRQFEPLRFPVAIDVLAPGAGTAGGTITVQAAVGAENCAIVLPANHCDLVPQTAGARDFAVSYSGDSHFLPSSASVQVQVLPDALFGSGFEQ